ncbi:2'-5' RNA ligase family protein [Nocardioides marinquilinus]|uniref:2'-5' RNA ligase family protein n=1 Tax=Nocardioides marinquilinus TaxID=1210400 RepID=A0ABP9PR55_9ACTN
MVTLVLDAATTARLDAERRALFPPGRTAVGAHLTLFHAVPGERTAQVLADVAEQARRPPFDVEVTGVVRFTRGVAYRVASSQLVGLHRELQRAWRADLTAQDRRRLQPHVTVQNKTTPEDAAATAARLSAAFAPSSARAEALAVWRYVGGPWQPVERFAFHPGTTRPG